MSRKDYQALAEELSRVSPSGKDLAQVSQWRTDVIAVANVLERDNPRFDRRRFYDAVHIWLYEEEK